MLEVAARGGRLILVTDAEGAEGAAGQRRMTFIPPTVPATVAPLVYALPVQFIALPVQFIAYHTAVIMGTPRRRSAGQFGKIGDGGVDGRSMRLAYRVRQVGNERIVTPRLQPGRANRASTVEQLRLPYHLVELRRTIVCSAYSRNRLGAAK
jgi:hypothetical protein